MLTAAMFAMATVCSGQQTSTKGMKYGSEKAYSGSESPGQLSELRLTVIENGEESDIAEIKDLHGFYEIKYKHDGKAYNKTLGARDIELLNYMLTDIYKREDYYQDYHSKKGPKGLEWHLGTKHKDGVFLLNVSRIAPQEFLIVSAVTSFCNNIFELTTYDKPFPTGKLLEFSYSCKGTMLPGGPEWTVRATADGGYSVTYLNDSGNRDGKATVEKSRQFKAKVGDDLTEILKAGKAQNYKDDYLNPGITDGSRWSLNVKFEGGTIKSRGYMDGPRDSSAINNSLDYLENLMKE